MVKARVVASTVAVLLALSFMGGGMAQTADQGAQSANIDWRQFAGQTITVAMVNHPWQQAIEPLIPQFEKLTGIKVNVNVQAENVYWDRSQLGLSSPNPPFDVFFLSMGINGYTGYVNNWFQPLDVYLNDPKLTDKKWYDFQDIFPAYRAGFQLPQPYTGTLYAVPMAGEVYLNYYRKDLFQKYGIDVSKLNTMSDWLNAVKQLGEEGKKANPRFYGATIRGANAGIIDELNGMVADYWGNQPYVKDRFVYFNQNWEPQFTNARIKEAFGTWAQLMKESAPGVTSFDWYQATQQFAEGLAATYWADSSVFASIFHDPKQSKVVGNVGYAPLPPTKTGHHTTIWSWGLAIPAKSQHKKAAWLFMEWATSRKIDIEAAKKDFGSVRQSTWKDPSYLNVLPPGYANAVSESMAIAYPSIYYIKGAGTVFERILDALHSMYQGTSTDSAMQTLQDQATALMKQQGLYK